MTQQAPERSSRFDEVAAAYVAAQSFRRGSLRIRAAYLREFFDLWPVLNRASTSADVARWLRLNVALVRRWQQPAEALAVEFYRSQHMAQLGRAATVRPAPVMSERQIVSNLASQGPAKLRRLRVTGLDELMAEEHARTAAAGAGGRLVLNGGRDALTAQEPIGWMRVTDGDPCFWCAMLASRGAVYQSAMTAGEDNTWHNSCGCTALPIFSRTDFMSDEALRYRGIWNASGGNLHKFRKAIEGRP